MTFATPAGVVPEVVDNDPDGALLATLTSVEPRIDEVSEPDVVEALNMLGWGAGELDTALPLRIAYAGARHLIVAAATRERLAELNYDHDRLAAYMTARELITVQLVWRESTTTRRESSDPLTRTQSGLPLAPAQTFEDLRESQEPYPRR